MLIWILVFLSSCPSVYGRISRSQTEIRTTFDKLQLLEESSGPRVNGAMVGSHLAATMACCFSIGSPAAAFHRELCKTLNLPVTMATKDVDEYLSKQGVSLGDITRPHPLLPSIPSVLALGLSLLLHIVVLVLLPTNGALEKALRWKSSQGGLTTAKAVFVQPSHQLSMKQCIIITL